MSAEDILKIILKKQEIEKDDVKKVLVKIKRQSCKKYDENVIC